MKLWKSRKLILLSMLLMTCVSFSCRRNPPVVAAPPQPPPPTPPPPPPPAPTITLTATPETITAGQQVTLAWEAANATSVVLSPEIGNVVAKGSQVVSPPSSVTYVATVKGPGGESAATRRVTVNVVPPPVVDKPVPPRPPVTASAAELFAKQFGSQSILFDYDSSEIRTDQIAKLQSHATWLKQNGSVRVSIEGHADERGSQEYNVALGDERAAAVMNYLVTQGIPAARLTKISYGEERPICRTQDEKCFQDNRRASFEMAN